MSTDEIFTMLASKFVPDPPQELTPSAPKVILFNEKVAKRFVVREQTADKGRQFILHVTAHAPVKISIGTNEEKPKFYSFDGTKAILIPALSWK